MAQKIVTLCDVHARNDEETGGAGWSVTLLAPGESKALTWEVDLCEDDGKTLRDLAVMLDAVGRLVDGPRRKVATAARKAARTPVQAHAAPEARATNTGRNAPIAAAHTAEGYPCPVEGCRKVPVSRSALMSHLRSQHGTSLAEAMGAPLPHVCPECGKGFSHVQGMGAHRRTKHGVMGAQRAGASQVDE